MLRVYKFVILSTDHLLHKQIIYNNSVVEVETLLIGVSTNRVAHLDKWHHFGMSDVQIGCHTAPPTLLLFVGQCVGIVSRRMSHHPSALAVRGSVGKVHANP